MASETTIVFDVLADFFNGYVGKHILAARLAGLRKHHSCAFHDLLAMPMSARYVPICSSSRCLVVIRWISYIRLVLGWRRRLRRNI
jgi:hypothetical protein